MQSEDQMISKSIHFIEETKHEWMSLNYRKERANNLSKSKRRMILIMFQKDFSYFPTMKDIRDELIQAQMCEIDKSSL